MPERPGEWNLLNRHRDPVVADVEQIEQLTVYYRDMAKDIEDQATVLRRIGEGDESQFKGESADRVREKSKQVGEQLTKMSGRYTAVRDALTEYLPALQVALAESAGALADATAANGAMAAATGMSDPRVGRPSDAPPLTTEEEAAGRAKDGALSDAKGSSTAAVARLENALTELDARGRRASETIRGAWNDGLKDSWQDRVKENFRKFLKILVKILTWIGVALALLAFFIPGLGMAALAGAIVTGLAFAATAAQAALGDASFVDVIIAGVGVLLLGAGALLTKLVSIRKLALVKTDAKQLRLMSERFAKTEAKLVKNNEKLTRMIAQNRASMTIRPQQQRAARWQERNQLRVERFAMQNQRAANLERLADLRGPGRAALLARMEQNAIHKTGIGKVDPNWWNLKKLPFLLNKDAKAFNERFRKSVPGYRGFRKDKLFGVDQVHDYNVYQHALRLQGIATPSLSPAISFFNGGRTMYGWAGTGFGLLAANGALPAYDRAKQDFPGGNERPEAPL